MWWCKTLSGRYLRVDLESLRARHPAAEAGSPAVTTQLFLAGTTPQTRTDGPANSDSEAYAETPISLSRQYCKLGKG